MGRPCAIATFADCKGCRPGQTSARVRAVVDHLVERLEAIHALG